MSTRSRTIRVAFGLTLLTLAIGCRNSPYGGGPYGQPGGYYGGQPTYGPYGQPSGGTFVAPGGAVPGPALPVAPSGGAFLPGTVPQAGIPGGNAPTFDPTTDVPSGDNLVPEYEDPAIGGGGDSFDSQPNFQDDAGFDDMKYDDKGFDDKGFDEFDDDAFKDAPFEDTSARPAYDDPHVELRGIEPLGVPAASEFEQPIPFEPTGTPSRLEETSIRTERPNPYAHDTKSFAWIRGTVDYEPSTRSWAVIYSLRPQRGDEFGGSIELAGPAALFRSLEPGDVVLVEGRIDRSDLDPRGKPRYRVDHLAELVPAE